MKQWQDFSATRDGATQRDNFICTADELGLILVNGEDATDFLQNQLSNDIALLDESHFQMSSYSTPKGRMIGIFRVIRISNGYILVTTRAMVLPLLERLFKFILRARVTLADASDYFARMAVQTDRPTVIEHPLLAATPGACLQNDSVVSLQLPPLRDQHRYLLLCLSAEEAIGLWSEFAQQLSVTGFASWRVAEIRAGIPGIYPQTAEEFVLQMANLDRLDAVSFKKGCYPGQEIVARMHYLGKLKRRMYLAELVTGQLPRPGDELVVPGKTEADGSGMIVDAEFDQVGNCLCLYVARIDRAEAGNLRLLDQPAVEIHNLELPYVLEN